MASIVWEKYCDRHRLGEAARDFGQELIDGADQRRAEACAAMLDEAAAECRAKGKRLDSYDLGTLAARMREGNDTL